MNSKFYTIVALVTVLAVGSAQAGEGYISMIQEAIKNGSKQIQDNLPRFEVPGKDFVCNQAQNFYNDPKGYATQAATDALGFVTEQGTNMYEFVAKNPGKSAAIASGVLATAVAVKYALPHAGWAYQRAKINGSKLVQKCVTTLDPVKQAAVSTAKFGWKAAKFATKTAVVGTVVAAPALVAYACENKQAVIEMANNAQDFVMSFFARA